MTREEAIKELKQFSGTTQLRLSANFWTAHNMAIKALEQEPCEDAVSRAEVLNLVRLNAFHVKSQIKAIENMPPVTPTRKTGHWIGRKKIGFGEWEDVTVLVNPKGCVTDSVECSNCGNWLTGSDEYECDARYCPYCGIKMQEV